MTSATAAAAAPSRADIEARIVKRCWADEAFRSELFADPAACFVKYTGLPAEQAPNIVVHEESGRDWHIVIPTRPAQAGELSDADLERVAGGTDPMTTVVMSVVSLTAVSVVATGSAAVSAASVVTPLTIAVTVQNDW